MTHSETIQALSRSIFHVSEEAGIAEFQPRAAATAPSAGPIVWAIDDDHLPNYLLPRDCPRVTFGVAADTSQEDQRRFGVGAGRVVVIEAGWLSRVCACQVHVYEFLKRDFRLFDETAGYWVASTPVTPLRYATIADLPDAIVQRGGELRIVHSLWQLHDEIASSTLAFSMIRMRNASR